MNKAIATATACIMVMGAARFTAAQDSTETSTTVAVSEPPAAAADSQDAPVARPVAYEYSDAYLKRAKIHKYASFATLPLFATEMALGQSLYNEPLGARKNSGAHTAVGIGIVALFGVNSVTGVWNMVEGWQNPKGRTKRLVHGLLMISRMSASSRHPCRRREADATGSRPPPTTRRRTGRLPSPRSVSRRPDT